MAWLKFALQLIAIAALAIWAIHNVLANNWGNVAVAMLAMVAVGKFEGGAA